MQPTRSIYNFRFKSYGLLCDFHKSLALDFIGYSKQEAYRPDSSAI